MDATKARQLTNKANEKQCKLDLDDWYYVGPRSSIHISSEGGIVSTTRDIYMCSCGREKPPENKDYR